MDHDGTDANCGSVRRGQLAASRLRGSSTTALPVAVVVFGTAVLWLATPFGAGLTSDSVTYLAGADVLIDHPTAFLSLTHPVGDLDHFPPLYPAVLAGVISIGFSPLRAAALVGWLSFVASAVLFHRVVCRYTSPRWAGVALTALILSDGFLILVHGWVMSEGLFIAISMGAVAMFERARTASGGRVFDYVVAGTLAGAATLTRFVGVAVLVALLVGVLLIERGRRALVIAGGLAVLGLSPLVVWVVSQGGGGDVGDRTVQWHPSTLEEITDASVNISKWFVPERVLSVWSGAVGLFVGVLLAGALLAAARYLAESARGRVGEERPLVTVFIVWAVGHVVLVLASAAVLDANIPLDQRLLFPAWIAAMGAIAVAIHPWWTAGPSGDRARRLVAVALGVLLVAWSLQLVADVRAARSDGLGYSSPQWEESEALTWIEGEGRGRVTHANGRDAIYLFTGEVVEGVPVTYDASTDQPNPDVAGDIRRMERRVLEADGRVVFFEATQRRNAVTVEDVIQATSLEVVLTLADAVVLGPPTQ